MRMLDADQPLWAVAVGGGQEDERRGGGWRVTTSSTMLSCESDAALDGGDSPRRVSAFGLGPLLYGGARSPGEYL